MSIGLWTCVCVSVLLCAFASMQHAFAFPEAGGGGVLSLLVATMQAVIEMQEGKRSPNLTLFSAAAAAGRETRRQKLLQAGKKGATPVRMKLFDGNKSGF